MRVTTLAIGRARGPVADLCAEYAGRLTWPFTLKELEPKPATQARESAALLAALPEGARVVVCDERGKNLSSQQFADRLSGWQDDGVRDVAFLLGGADGHSDEIRKRADLILGFGQLTWPHMLARIMLLEQIYRAQQIIAGHPYHRA